MLRNVSQADTEQHSVPAAARLGTPRGSDRCSVPNTQDQAHPACTQLHGQGKLPEPGENWGDGDTTALRKGSKEGAA